MSEIEKLDDLHDKVLNLLMTLCEKAYLEGRKHQLEEEGVVGIAHMKTFEETDVHKEIKDNWK